MFLVWVSAMHNHNEKTFVREAYNENYLDMKVIEEMDNLTFRAFRIPIEGTHQIRDPIHDRCAIFTNTSSNSFLLDLKVYAYKLFNGKGGENEFERRTCKARYSCQVSLVCF